MIAWVIDWLIVAHSLIYGGIQPFSLFTREAYIPKANVTETLATGNPRKGKDKKKKRRGTEEKIVYRATREPPRTKGENETGRKGKQKNNKCRSTSMFVD